MSHVESTADRVSLRRAVFTVLTLMTLALTTARIVAVERNYEPSMYRDPSIRKWPTTAPIPTPMFSSNDRSRWATVRALVDHGTFVIGQRIEDPQQPKGYRDEGIIFENHFASVDRIKNPETGEFYSSKPTLFTVMLAGEYWLLKHTLGWSIVDDHWPVICTMILTVNVLPLLLYLLLFQKIIERYITDDWAQLIAYTFICAGTFLTTFAVTLNNHIPAAVCVLIAMYPLLMTPKGTPIRTGHLIGAGVAAGFAMTLELPAAAFLAGIALFYLWRDRFRALRYFIPAALIPLLALGITNTIVLGEPTPAYAKFGGPWYEYPGSHWYVDPNAPPKTGIDFADEPKWLYTFQVLIGHHGVLSLTPMWFLSLMGMLQAFRDCRTNRSLETLFFVFSFALTLVVVVFYIGKTNNYGGWTGGPRWFFWLTPIWTITLFPILQQWATRPQLRQLTYALLTISIFSASYPFWNPWRHPWIYQLCEYMNWVRY